MTEITINLYDTKGLDRFVEAYNKYLDVEFGEEPISAKEAMAWNEIGVLYTTNEEYKEFGLEQDDVAFEVSYCLSELACNYYVNENLLMQEKFKNFDEMAEDMEISSFQGYYEALAEEFYHLLASKKIKVRNHKIKWIGGSK